MPQLTQITLLNASTATGVQSAYDIRDVTAYSVYVSVSGGTSADFQIEGTADPLGRSGFDALAMRPAGGGAYATTAVQATPASPESRYFDPSDNVCWIRVNITANVGPGSVTVIVNGEQ